MSASLPTSSTARASCRKNIVDAARDIVANVRANGDAAVCDYCQRFDGVELQSFRLPQEQIDAALEGLDPAFVAALEKAARQIREFHQREVEQSWFTTRADGTMLGVKVTPLAAAGIYVPGGRAQYPSTVLMNAIPAKVAGVKRVVMVTPPQKDGLISPYTLAAAKLGGVDEIYMVGGAQAVAALAYGTETIPRVDKITGPGNAFVAAAKQIVSGDVGIDMVAGPSEVCVLADATAKPMVVAADLMAQAEHDPLAACYLVTCDEQFAREVEAGIDILVAQSLRAEITRASLDNEGTIVVAADMAAAVEAVNTVAPEHLELHCKDAMGLLGGIRNAGAIFVGAWSSEPLGDYVAGPNHTLPTGGTAMFSNPLYGRRIRQAFERHLLYARGPALRRSRHAASGRGRGPVGARAFGRTASPRVGAGRGCRERRVARRGRPDQGCLAGRRRGDGCRGRGPDGGCRRRWHWRNRRGGLIWPNSRLA